MFDHPMTERNPLILGNKTHEVLFNLVRIFLCGETQSLADPRNVRVHDYS